MSEPDDDVPLDKLARIYRKIGARITEITKAFDTEIESLKAQQDTVKLSMKDKMQALGVTSVRTLEGTVVLGKTTRYYAQDWDEFKTFVKEHDALDLLERRIAQRNMGQFLEEHPGVVCPGLNSNSEFQISVRKPT